MGHPVLVWLGQVSFAFFLCHLTVIHLVTTLLPRTLDYTLLPAVALVAVELVLSIGLCAVLHHGVGVPANNRLRALTGQRKAVVAQV